MKAYIVFISILTISIEAQGQDSSFAQNKFCFMQGFTHVVNQDLYRSPYTYKGVNSLTEVMYERSTSKTIHRAYVGFAFGSVKTHFSPLAPDNFTNLNYSYLRRIITNKKIHLYLGPQLDLLSWRINYFPEMQVPNYGKVRSYMLSTSFGLAASIKYNLNTSNSLSLFASSPVCTYFDRPNFLDGSDRQIKFGILNFWNPKIRLTYEWKASDKLALLVNYQYNYFMYSRPKAIRMLNNSLTLGLNLTF